MKRIQNHDLANSDELSCVRAALASQPDVAAAYLFGSLARGEATPRSDMDIAVLLRSPLAEEERVLRRLELMALLEPVTARAVQVITLDDAPPVLAFAVISEGILLLDTWPADRIDFEVRAMKRYFDILPLLHSQHLAQARRLEEGRYGQRDRYPHALDAARELLERIEGSASN